HADAFSCAAARTGFRRHTRLSTRRCLPAFGRFLCPPAPKPLSVATGRYHSCFGTAPSDATASSNPLSSRRESANHLSAPFAWCVTHRFGLNTIQARLALAATPPRRCPTGSSHWLRLAGKQETGFTFSQ